jgi:hypothetical protein
MCQPVSHQSGFSLIFFVQQEPEPEPRARIRFRFLGQNDMVLTVPVPQHCLQAVQRRLDLKALCTSFHSLQLSDYMDSLVKFFDIKIM